MNNINLSHTVLEAKKPRIKVVRDSVCGKCLFFIDDTFCVLTRRKGQIASFYLFLRLDYQGLIRFSRALPFEDRDSYTFSFLILMTFFLIFPNFFAQAGLILLCSVDMIRVSMLLFFLILGEKLPSFHFEN